MRIRSLIRRPRTWLIAVPLAIVLGVVGGPFVYINFIRDDPPPRLELSEDVASEDEGTDSADATGLAGSWTVSEAEAGYRVKEVLFGQDTEAVGRTTEVTGSLEVEDITITDATFTVDLTTVNSDEDRRDRQFQGRIMDTASFPTATFALTEPIALDEADSDGGTFTVTATGDFTIRGVTRSVTFEVLARRAGSSFEVNGSIPVTFADFDIPDASFGPASVQDRGEIEFLLTFSRA